MIWGCQHVRVGRKYIPGVLLLLYWLLLSKVTCYGRQFRNYVLKVFQAVPQMVLIQWVLCGCAKTPMVYIIIFSLRDDLSLRFPILFILLLYPGEI